MGPGVRTRPACRTAGMAASRTMSPTMRAMLPKGSPRSREYSHGMAKAKRSNKARVAFLIGNLKPLRINQARVERHANRGLDGRLEGPVPHIFGHRVGDEENVAIVDGKIGVLAVNHAAQVERGQCATTL